MMDDPAIPQVLLVEFSEFVARRLGLHFPRERWRDLVRGAQACAPVFGGPDAATCMEWLLSHPVAKSELRQLASHLTVGETYFFREEPSFAALKDRILPDLIQRRGKDKRLRIWSAGCCSGEEPYSIAILLKQVIPTLDDWSVTLLATDINPKFLMKAQRAQYGEWSFRQTPLAIKERYFSPAPRARVVALDPDVRRRVTFAYLNLAEDSYPSFLNGTNAIDIIFCRNVLMYFRPEHAQTVIRKLYSCLADDGWLVVSPSEASPRLFNQFTAVNFPGVVVFRKTNMGLPARVDTAPRSIATGGSRSTVSVSGERGFTAPAIVTPPIATVHDYAPTDSFHEADTLYDQGRYHEVIDILQALLVHDPENAMVMTKLAKVCANQGRLAEALVWCERAIAIDRLDSAARYLLAIIFQEQGRDANAIVALKHVLYLDPTFALAHFALGNSARALGRREESRRHFANALAILAKDSTDYCPPESDGMTVGRLREIIEMLMSMEGAA